MVFIGIFLCIVAAGFFSGLETGLLAANQLALYSKAEKRILYARAANFLIIKPERLLSITLIGTNVAVISSTVLLKSFLSDFGLHGWFAWLGSLLLSFFLLIFSEILPKSFFRRHADTISVRFAPVLVCFYFLFLPLSVFLNFIIAIFLFILRQKKVKRGPRSRADLKLLLKLVGKEAAIPVQSQHIFDDIFDFNTTMAREVMIPFYELTVCSLDSSLEKLITLYMKTKSRFIMIFAERADNIAGYVNINDLVTRNADKITDIMKKPVFYPDTKKIPDLLMVMNRHKLDMVFLSDEYGGICGMITANEIASEIIGYIPGHRKKSKKLIERVADNKYIIAGTTDLDDLLNQTGFNIAKGNYDTVGGFLCDKLGIIPQTGVTFEEKGILFNVLDSDERHVKKIEVQKVKRDESDAKAHI